MYGATLFAHEIELDKFVWGDLIRKNENDVCIPLQYDQGPLRIQTPWMKNVFGIQSYSNPGSTTTKYSISLNLKPVNDEVKAFDNAIRNLESEIQASDLGFKSSEFFSSIRAGKPGFPDHIRIKIPANKDTLKMKLFIGTEDKRQDEEDTKPLHKRKINPVPLTTAKEFIKHGKVMRLVIELNPIWSAGGKYGISWKVIRVQVPTPQSALGFR